MNLRNSIVGLAIILLGTTLFWIGTDNSAKALAAGEDSHAGHNHGNENDTDPLEKELEALFAKDQHVGCDHAKESSEHEGSNHGNENDIDLHEEEPKALFAEDEHAGHDHGDENDAGHEDEALLEEDEHAGHGHGDENDADHEDEALLEEDEHAGHGHASSDDGICPEHNVAEAKCALCQGGHIGDLRPGQGMKVRLATLDVAAKAGIRLARPQQVSAADGIDIPAQVAFDRKQLAYITPLTAGVIRQVHVQPGDKVQRGDVLAEIAMPEVSTLKAEFATAQAQQTQTEAAYHREQDLLERGISSRQEFQQAESDYRSSQSATERYRQQLLNFGLSTTDIKQLSQAIGTSASVSLRAPFHGVVTDVQTAMGEAVSAGSALFTVANLDSLWIELSIPESRSYLAQVDSNIQARFDGLPGTLFSGRLFQVGASIDQRTRTLKALAEVQNPGHRLKVGMFGSVRILAGDETESLAIPADAVQNIDGQPYVFIQEESDLFELRRVVTGANQDGMIVIPTGLASNDQVVVGQGFALKSEVLKARLGASCADH